MGVGLSLISFNNKRCMQVEIKRTGHMVDGGYVIAEFVLETLTALGVQVEKRIFTLM